MITITRRDVQITKQKTKCQETVLLEQKIEQLISFVSRKRDLDLVNTHTKTTNTTDDHQKKKIY